MTGIRVAVVDDHPLFREGVTRSLSEIDGFEIVAEGGSRDEAVAIAQSLNPDVMLLDISMPGGGLNAVPAILSVAPSQKIVMLTVSEANDDVAAALKEGAKGYILKGIGARALAEVIRTVASGELCRPHPFRQAADGAAGQFCTGQVQPRCRADAARTGGPAPRRLGNEQQADCPKARSARENGETSHDADHGEARRRQPDGGGHGAARRARLASGQSMKDRSRLRSAEVARRLTIVRPRESFMM